MSESTNQNELDFVERTCAQCGKIEPALTNVNNTYFCLRCLNQYFFRCGDCNVWKSRTIAFNVRTSGGYGKLICPACTDKQYTKCDRCQYYSDKKSFRRHDNHTYCVYCFEDMFTCVGCHQRLFRENYFDAGLCHRCYDEERRIITPHDTRAPMEFRGKGPHFFGIELEVECDEKVDRRANFARKILSIFNGFAITKHDGSIKDKNGNVIGFEIATVPASKQVQMEHWNAFFDDKPKEGLRSYDTQTCGLHIHCSRQPLTQLTIAKMLLFVNSKENAYFITMIAGRPANHYCKISEKTLKDVRYSKDRYEALNLTNRGTVEFRIFRGTLKRESLFKSIEFCDALIHFCGNCNYSVADSRRVDKFIEYVKLNSKEWPHLWAFICARWLGVENKLTKQYGFPLSDKPAEMDNYNNEPNPARQENQNGLLTEDDNGNDDLDYDWGITPPMN